jgi:hypothetical protein
MVGKYNRSISIRKAKNKRQKSKAVHRGYEWFNNLHQYSKNKFHCSCPYCSMKTRNKGHRRYKAGNYVRAINYKASDIKKMMVMDFNLGDTFGNPLPRRKTDW